MTYIRKQKIRWHSRRSILELDLFFDRFLNQKGLDSLDEAELKLYEQLLEYKDEEILLLFTNRITASNEDMQMLIKKICEIK
ncbi:MAG: citrate (Si)-synthase [Pseudomonadota bacterium]|jgi:succinate dehydrogenase flavin-adding protein (antitoxin of CptAB toxin-antitoxin module)|nr:succinate dehydrogenase assembly factor 2 [Burkholderiales bacterium]